MSDDIHAERRIHQLEEQLRNARDDALEEAAKIALWYATPREIAKHILAQKGRPA